MSTVESAKALVMENRLQEAAAMTLELLQHHPEDAQLWMIAGVARFLEGHLQEAQRMLRRASDLDPSNVECLLNLATVLERLQRQGDAHETLLLAKKLEPDNPRVRQGLERLGPPDYLAPTVQQPRTGQTLKRLRPSQSPQYIYVVEVTGSCNLKCPSCPTGALSSEGRVTGLMSLDLFQKVVDKILVESPSGRKTAIWFFNWGEPMLNKELPQMVAYARERGLTTMVSTNLNHNRGLEALVEAGPSVIKISISGFREETYERTHRRGKFERVRMHLEKLSELIKASAHDTVVTVGQHVYKTNQEDVPKLGATCAQLGFLHQPVPAAILATESNIDMFYGRASPDETETEELLLVSTIDKLTHWIVHKDHSYDCEMRYNMMVLNPDATVALCCGVWAPENMLGAHFLEHSHEELERMKYEHSYCDTCYAHGMAYLPCSEPKPERLQALEKPEKLVQLRKTRAP